MALFMSARIGNLNLAQGLLTSLIRSYSSLRLQEKNEATVLRHKIEGAVPLCCVKTS